MTVEAALLGKPAISCFPGEKPLYIRYLEKESLVRTIQQPRRIVAELQKMLSSPEYLSKQKVRGYGLLSWMEDPIPKIAKYVTMASAGQF
jgi:predicted glycosyltransferase